MNYLLRYFYIKNTYRMGYDNRIRAKYTAKWGVQIAEMIFQTRSGLKMVDSAT